jgi:hypothetical protein
MNNTKILTWNIFWQIMKKSNTAKDNVLDIIRKLKSESYDFIALQEASYIYKDLDKNKYEYIITTVDGKFDKNNSKSDELNTLITLYDSTKYNVVTMYGNKINRRPYHIIYFSDIINSKKILFINFHNNHGVQLDTLQDKLNKKINEFIFTNKISNIDNIIICADWNYDYKELLLKINNTKKKIGNNNTLKPKTCCHNENKLLDYSIKTPMFRPGDYIFFSDNFNVIINNELYSIDQNKIYSDHLPVHTILEYKDTQTPVPEPVYTPVPEPVFAPVLVPEPVYAPVPEPVYAPVPASKIILLQTALDLHFEKMNLIIKKN